MIKICDYHEILYTEIRTTYTAGADPDHLMSLMGVGLEIKNTVRKVKLLYSNKIVKCFYRRHSSECLDLSLYRLTIK